MSRAVLRTLAVVAVGALAAGCSSSTHQARTAASSASVTSTTPPIVTTTTVAAHPPVLRCAARLPRDASGHTARTAVGQLVPGSPVELLACRYHGFNQPQPSGTLAASHRFAPGPVAAALNGARRVPNGAVFNCPIDFGEQILLLFGYDDGQRVNVTVSTAGCRFATSRGMSVWTPPSLLRRLEAVLGHDHL